jgi:indolepyruvate ferredoxin oxidoreductase
MYTDGEFERKLRAQFDGDIRLTFNLAPPLLSRPDPKTGIARKMTFGPWMLPAFRVLAKFKFLRGSVLDPFGRLEDRKLERALIARYENLLDTLQKNLSVENIDMAAALAAIPDQIRGYGHIKTASVREAQAREKVLLERFRNGDFEMPPIKSKVRKYYEVTL